MNCTLHVCRRSAIQNHFKTVHVRCLHACQVYASGHSKWATIKHDKAKNDAALSRQRTGIVKDISFAVKLSGSNPQDNPRLEQAITHAKKCSVPKAVIEAAIARGQGLSTSGAKLENVSLEAMVGSVAMIIECETDNRLRTLQDLRSVVKDWDGRTAATAYLFAKHGRITLRSPEGSGASEEDILESALDAGAMDMIVDPEGFIVLTDPNETAAVADNISHGADLTVSNIDVVWVPNLETKTVLDDEVEAKNLLGMLEEVRDVNGVQTIFMNATKGSNLDGEVWSAIQDRL